MATNFMTVKFDKWLDRDVKIHKSGVTLIHLFNEIWRTGRLVEKKGKPAHLVIYSPQDKEYHVYGKEATDLMSNFAKESRDCWRVDQAKVKIYILTSILDQKENWSFDLTSKPIVGSVYVVVYNNGTIKKIVSSGNWDPIEIDKKYDIGDFKSSLPKTIYPIGYKIQ